MKNNFVSVAKQIIRAAAGLGLEEAGTRIMGSAWAPFKAMMTPVYSELEKRYPKFFLLDVPKGSTPSDDAKRAAELAVADLDKDPMLQKMLQDGFNNLADGQYEIKSQISKMELRLEALNMSIDDLATSSDDKFTSVITQLDSISQKLDTLGTSVEVKNKSVLVPLAFDLPKGSIEAYLTIYFPGIEPVQLTVDKNRPYSTVNVLYSLTPAIIPIAWFIMKSLLCINRLAVILCQNWFPLILPTVAK